MSDARKGLLVDYGGVLTTPMTRSFKAYAIREGLDREVLKDVFAEALASPDGAIHRVETGEVDGAEFAAGLAAALERRTGEAYDPEELIDGLFAEVKPEKRMLDAVAAARAAGVATGLLSNSWGGRERYPYHRFDELFDAVVISGEVGVRKPDPAIYRIATDRLGVPPEACVFVDDLERNIEAAEELGMTGVLHKSPDETIAALAELLGLPPEVLETAP